jgi:pimeloyl-ACP methyl ester carboxylesterase
MHGIRDLGEWSSRFETGLQERARKVGNGKLAIASIRYGYFGMGQFLLKRDRQKYVRWFMDQYTETLARYPMATEIDFVGHSNGTYLLTSALEKYPAMRVRRVVLGGSVVAKDYDWKRVFDRKQVAMVRNYVAEDDWVVALFPRFFEPLPMRLLGNDIGSAGFNGFDAGNDGPNRQPVENIKFITGHHAAFLAQLDQIVHFLIPAAGEAAAVPNQKATQDSSEPARTWPLLKFISDWLTWLVWLPLAFVIIWLGSRVSDSAGHLSAAALILYLALVFQVLRWI